MGKVICTRHLFKNFGNRSILRDISVCFEPGHIHYLIGQNGSGKSSFLHCLAGLANYSGNILIDEQPASSLNRKELAQTIALVPQKLTISFRIRVYDFVLGGRFPYLNWLGQYKTEDHRITEEQLERLDIQDLKKAFLDQLSGGELQKVILARALCQMAPILLFDEPTQSLDPPHRNSFYPFLRSLLGPDKTFICATHDLFPLNDPAVRTLGLANGIMVLDQKGAVSQAQIEQVYGKETGFRYRENPQIKE